MKRSQKILGICLLLSLILIEAQQLSAQPRIEDEEFWLEVQVDRLRLRDSPGLQSNTAGYVSEGDVVRHLFEVSKRTDKVTLRGVRYKDPWIKVATRSGLVGWAYGGALKYPGEEVIKKGETVYFKRPEDICEGLYNTSGCMQREEMYCLHRSNMLAYRRGRTLKIKLASGLWYTLEDDPGEAGRSYFVLSDFSEAGYVGCATHYYDGSAEFLLNLKTSKQTFSGGKMNASPGQRYVVGYDTDVEWIYGWNGFQIWDLKAGPEPVEVFSHESTQEGDLVNCEGKTFHYLVKPVWESENLLRFEKRNFGCRDAYGVDYDAEAAYLKKVGDDWKWIED